MIALYSATVIARAKKMKLISKTAAALTLVFCASAQAAPINIADVYEGADGHGYGDVIGNAAWFGISSMDVELVNNMLTVTINTPFPDAGLGTFGGIAPDGGVAFGDLFLSSTGWDPSGTGLYSGDDHSNGTQWDFGISLTDRWSETSAATLYGLDAVVGNPDALLSDDFLTGGVFRNGQEVAVNTGTANMLTNTATFGTSTGKVIFTVDVAGTALANADSIGLHWAMTCGNDTIEGEYNVPEPSVIALFGLGLLGLGFARRRKYS
jgi:hypothetical protein